MKTILFVLAMIWTSSSWAGVANCIDSNSGTRFFVSWDKNKRINRIITLKDIPVGYPQDYDLLPKGSYKPYQDVNELLGFRYQEHASIELNVLSVDRAALLIWGQDDSSGWQVGAEIVGRCRGDRLPL